MFLGVQDFDFAKI